MHASPGLTFGNMASDYVRGRPAWPVDAVEAAGVPAASRVLDLAAGTGKLTEVLAGCFAEVIAVEPDAEMRAANPAGDVRAGTADTIPLEDGSVDAVFVAEAFHWFGAPDTLYEIERVLRPGGTLVLLWNRPREVESTPRAGVHAVMERLTDEAHSHLRNRFFHSDEWQALFEGTPFGPIEEAAFDHEHVVDREGLLSYFLSQSTVAWRPPAERAAVRAELEGLIPDGPHVRLLRARVYWTRLPDHGGAAASATA